jgi:hypothetical protein
MLSNTQFSYSTLQRLRWFIHVAGIFAVAAFAYLGWQVQSSILAWHSQMENEIEQDRQLLGEMQKIEEQLTDAMRSRDRISASFRELRDRVPSRLVDSDILQSVEEIVAACECKLNDFRPIGSQVIETKEIKCTVRLFQLNMEGSYTGLFAFTRELNRFPFSLHVKRLHLIAPTDSNPRSRIDLEIGILCAPEWGESELVSAKRDSA